MIVPFSKYQGTGNDFILLDNRNGDFSALQNQQIRFLCDRNFGIGADGLICLENKEGYDFYMRYFNSDGNESSMCGNGGRCITAYAHAIKITGLETKFSAIDGEHQAQIKSINPFIVKLKMGDVPVTEKMGNDIFINTGSPHYVRFVTDVGKIDVLEEARAIRYGNDFRSEGTNVNFVQPTESGLKIRSYERGVENETLSCGTGVTASVLAGVVSGKIKARRGVCEVKTLGGLLSVYYEADDGGFTDVWLEGEAKFVFAGQIEI